jgi:CheY-like chemotaxis protein
MAGGRLSIVLVEDDIVDVMNLQRAFARENVDASLFVANDGIDGLELLRSDRVPKTRRLVLLDIDLPRMSGIEMLREMRKDEELRSTPVVVLTTSDQEQDLMAAYALHVAGYLVKRSTFPDFAELVGTMSRYWSLAEMP